MSKFAERLIILKDAAESLLARVYNVKNALDNDSTRPLVFQTENKNVPDMKRIFRELERNYPDFQEKKVEQIKEYDFIKQNLSKILSELQPIFVTFSEIVEWTEHAQRLLDELCVTYQAEFEFDVNILIMADFLSIVSLFVKLILMVNRIEERKQLLSMFNLAFTKINGQSDPNVTRVAKFFTDYSSPYAKIQEVMTNIQKTVGLALVNLSSSYEKGTLQYLTVKRPLELLSDPDRIPYPHVDKTYTELCYYEQIRDWTIWCSAVCPEALAVVLPSTKSLPKEKQFRALDLLFKVISDTFIVSVYGDECIHVHEPFEDLFSRYKSAAISLKKEKKALKAIEEKAAAESHDIHEQRRQYLRLQLKSLQNMLCDNPGLLGPKFQLVLGLMSLAKAELLWFFRHMGQVPKAFATNKKFKESSGAGVGEMIHVMDEISQVCTKHRDIISSYHRKGIASLYHRRVTELVEQHKTRFEAQNVQILDSITADIANASDFEALRLNWKRLNAVLSGVHFRTSLTDPGIRDLLHTVNKVYAFSRHIDDIEAELVEQASLRELYFFHGPVMQIFTQGMQPLQTTQQQSGAFFNISLIRTLHYYCDNINKHTDPELRKKVGLDAVEFSERMLQDLVHCIQENVNEVRSKHGFGSLWNQIGGDKVASRIIAKQKQQQEAAAGGKNAVQQAPGDDTPTLGQESTYSNKQSIAKFYQTAQTLTQLLFAIGAYPEIQVYDTVFVPLEFLRDCLQQYCQEFVRKLSNRRIEPHPKDAKAAEFIPPSTILYNLHVLFYVLKFIEQCVPINTEDLAISAYLENFVHSDYAGESPYDPAATGEDVNSVYKYARWYSDTINSINRLKLVYHPVRRNFFNGRETQLVSYAAEDFMDIQELMAMSELVGPYGIRAFDHHLLAHIQTSIEKIRDILVQQQTVLQDVEKRLYEDNLLEVIDKRVKGFDMQLMQHFITLGALLAFRDNMRQAHEFKMQKNLPVISDLARSVRGLYRENVFGDNRFIDMDGIAYDCGLPLGASDNAFKKRISVLVENTQQGVWELLPVAFSLLVASDVWKDKNYDSNMEGWETNEHCAAYAFSQLVVAVSSIRAPDVHGIELEFEKFAQAASQILLNMRLTGSKYSQTQQQNGYIFFDVTLKRCGPFLKRRYYEDNNPYALVRAAYIEFYDRMQRLARSKTGGTAADVSQDVVLQDSV